MGLEEEARLHSAGAIVRRHSPFSQLPGWRNADALTYLDEVNATALTADYGPAWAQFVQNKPHRNPVIDASETREAVAFLRRLANCLSAP